MKKEINTRNLYINIISQKYFVVNYTNNDNEHIYNI